MLPRRSHAVAVYLLLCFAFLLCAKLASAQGTGYWHTSGAQIVDANGATVRIAGINWYGFETTDLVAHGLNVQDYKTILQAIKNNGYNTVRIPFSNQMVESPIVPGYVAYSNSSGAINTDLRGLNSLQILDAIVTQAGGIGLRVILDNHRSEAGNSAEASGLWYTSAYPESAWINDWVTLATRYKGNPTVIGMDLRNEPHNANSGGACWSCGSSAQDWHLAAARAGNAILAVNPSLLIFVEGTDAIGSDYYFWGGQLAGVATAPVTLNVANQLVYSAHDYGPVEASQPWFNGSTRYDSLASNWSAHWGYIAAQGIAPVWVGEFGTPNSDIDVSDTTAGSQGQWFSSLIQYLSSNPSINWTYWALNGEDNYGLLDSNYDGVPANAAKQTALASIQFPLSGTTSTSPTLTLGGTPSTVVAASSSTDTGSSGNVTEAGYSAVLTNGSSSSLSNGTITITLPSQATVVSASTAGSTGSCTGTSLTYSCTFATVAAGGSAVVDITVIYPESSLNFGSATSVALTTNASAQIGAGSPLTASTTTTVTQRLSNSTTGSLQATASPGTSFAYGTPATVSFSLSPAPITTVPVSAFSATIDGGSLITVSSTGSNSWQIQLGVLTGGAHNVAIQMAASSGYAASSTTIGVTVTAAAPTITYSPNSATYGASTTGIISVNGVPGNGMASPTGSATISIDNGSPIQSTLTNAAAPFTVPTSLTAGIHSLSFSYTGDTNYLPQSSTGSFTVNPAALVAAANSATRVYGAANPAFTGILTGVANSDGITATYISQATTTTAADIYSTGQYAINPVLADPNSRLSNYNVTLTPGVLTIAPLITWANPAAIVYGTPLGSTQLNATSSPALTLTYSPPAGSVLNAGNQTLTVSGVNSTFTTPITASVTLVVQMAPTSTIVSAPSTITSPYTVAATVTSGNAGAVTGPVNFFDEGVLIGSGMLDNKGTATFVIPTLASGAHSFTATYPGDANNLQSTAAAVYVGATGGGDFTLAVAPASLTLSSGQTGTATLSANPSGGISGAVTLDCSGLPNGSTCSFAPATLTFNGSAAVQSTTVTITMATNTAANGSHSRVFYALLPNFLLAALCFSRKQRTRLHQVFLLVLLSVCCIGASSCASDPKFSTGGGTYQGSYNAVVKVSSGTVVHSTVIQVGLVQ